MKKGILTGICIITLAVLIYKSDTVHSSNDSTTLETISVKTQNLYNSVVAQGSIVGYERQSIIFSEPSNILDIYVKTGDSVKRGDRILLRKTSEAANASLKSFANSVYTFLTEHGIESSFFPTVSEKTALVTSNISGIVTEVTAQAGKSLPGFTIAAEICDTNRCNVVAEIPELYISSIRIDQEATINGPAFEKESYRGTVTEISEKAQKTINLTGESETYFPIKITLTETDNSLRPGSAATVKIKTAERKNASVIPYDCITQDENGKEFVYILKQDGTVEKRRILTGLELDHETEILYGLKPGDQVIRNAEIMTEE